MGRLGFGNTESVRLLPLAVFGKCAFVRRDYTRCGECEPICVSAQLLPCVVVTVRPITVWAVILAKMGTKVVPEMIWTPSGCSVGRCSADTADIFYSVSELRFC